MVNNELFAALKMLEKEKGIPMDVLCDGIQRALVTAIKRDYNNKDIVFCELDPAAETIRVFVRKNVVNEISDPDEDILVETIDELYRNRQKYIDAMNSSNLHSAADTIVKIITDEMIERSKK